MRERLYWIDVEITLLIILVIAGHCNFPFQPPWYKDFHSWIYSFHMAAFFFVSGFLIYYTYRPLQNFREYFLYVGRKLKKFGIPFVLFGTILSLYSVLIHDGTWDDYMVVLKRLFLDTMASPVIYLWFIYVLLEFYIFAPLFCQYYKYSIIFGILVAILLQIYPLPRLFSLHMFSRYLLFFLLGVTSCRYREVFQKISTYLWTLAWIPFIVWGILERNISEVFYGIIALPCLFLSAKVIADRGYGRFFFENVSKECYFIYLLQMIFINILALLIRAKTLSSWAYILFMFCSVIVSIAVSLLAAKIFQWATNKIKRMGSSCASRG